MMQYASQYGDFTILDGTFCVSKYDLVLVIFTNVDCLFKSTITGIVLSPAERSDPVVRAARRFGLAQEAAVLMTDQASAFATAASVLKKIHILCLHHFRTAMFSSQNGMAQETRDHFFRVCNALIFNIFESPIAFETHIKSAELQFSEYSKAIKFLKSLWDNRQSVCATFTAAHFKAGHVSLQRAECNNSRIKEGGQLKKELSTYNLQRLLDHLLSIIRDQKAKAQSAIKSCIRNGDYWSKDVDELWKTENNYASEHDCKMTVPFITHRCLNSLAELHKETSYLTCSSRRRNRD